MKQLLNGLSSMNFWLPSLTAYLDNLILQNYTNINWVGGYWRELVIALFVHKCLCCVLFRFCNKGEWRLLQLRLRKEGKVKMGNHLLVQYTVTSSPKMDFLQWILISVPLGIFSGTFSVSIIIIHVLPLSNYAFEGNGKYIRAWLFFLFFIFG